MSRSKQTQPRLQRDGYACTYPTIIVELSLAEVSVLALVDSVAVAREGGLGDGARAEALDVHQVVRRIHYAEGNPV